MATYGTIVTGTGEALLANCFLVGRKLDITHIAVGDGGGAYYQPDKDMTRLKNELWRGKVNSVSLDEASPNVVVITGYIPADVGGFTIREAGVFDADGNLIGVLNTPDTQKVIFEDGAMADLYLQVNIAVSYTDAIQFTTDPSAVLATQTDIRRHNDDPQAHGGLKHNNYELTTIRHELNCYPMCTLHQTRHALGVTGLGEGPLGGETLRTVSADFELDEKHSVTLHVPQDLDGEVEVHQLPDGAYSVVYEDGREESLYLMMR